MIVASRLFTLERAYVESVPGIARKFETAKDFGESDEEERPLGVVPRSLSSHLEAECNNRRNIFRVKSLYMPPQMPYVPVRCRC
jgi:hypothetical protein